MGDALDTASGSLRGIADWVAASPGLAALWALVLIALAAAVIVFWVRLARIGRRVPVARPEAGGPATAGPRPPADRAQQRRLAGMFFALDRIGGNRRKPAKRALMAGQTAIARAVFAAAADDHPADSARGLALVAEEDGAPEEARGHFARMHAMNRGGLGPGHPQTRQGAVLYAAFLRAHAPGDPDLAALEADYGDGIGR